MLAKRFISSLPTFLFCIFALLLVAITAFRNGSTEPGELSERILIRMDSLHAGLQVLQYELSATNLKDSTGVEAIRKRIHRCRIHLKRADFFLRYADPLRYRFLHGPLPVEWETEVFEKYEPPYMRRAGGLMLIENELNAGHPNADSMQAWCNMAITACEDFRKTLPDKVLTRPDWFLFANRLFLLNLFTIYTTGYECPSTERRIPELRDLCLGMEEYYRIFRHANPGVSFESYQEQYAALLGFLAQQQDGYEHFPHYTFIRDHVAPLYALNARMILETRAVSRNLNDYSLNNEAATLFDAGLYQAQHRKGVFSGVRNESQLVAIRALGSKLFYDPILSGNLQRSCASCHKPGLHFADTVGSPLAYNGMNRLSRNTPSLYAAASNQLLMHDGARFNLQEQARHVIGHVREMAGGEKQIMDRIRKIPEYRRALVQLAAYTPELPGPSFEHVLSALTYYYSSYGDSLPDFFRRMRSQSAENASVISGFNLFMGKAACATCHFLPHMNGVKPPYTGSEFEVIGTPADKNSKQLSIDSGRFLVHPAPEMLRAFRTPGLWNIHATFPYMHNGVYERLEEVIEFYDAGGGVGKGLLVPNQTLASDSLHLTKSEKSDLILFLKSLSTNEVPPHSPDKLPPAHSRRLSARLPGGIY